MKIQSILSKKGEEVHSINPDSSLKEAIKMLVDFNIGALLVVEKEHPVGIISERDVLKLSNQDPRFLETATVGEVMTKDVICAHADDEIDSIMSVMTQVRIRHIPVVENDKICGLISIRDIMGAKLEERTVTIKYLRDYITGYRG